ncbi:cytochrome P450 6B4-like [Leptopilina boulardi]|uniref:cytochrome P450 6B4-like n=1 Tax=Leptopilina boulardi TaxID=63433 RepID=UPI0021F54F1A|nr:cytochrome P450 6B4-like [Leptopilina boulardi]
MELIFATVAFVLFLLYFYISWQYNYFQKNEIPSANKIVPGLGHMLPVFSEKKNLATLCEDFYNEAKEYSMYGFYELCSPVLLVREPELVKNILLTNFSSFSENPFKLDYQDKNELFSLNPFFVEGDKWKEARAPHTHSFSSVKLKQITFQIAKIADKMNKYLSNQCKNGEFETNLKKLCKKFTGEVSSTAIGIETHNFEDLKPRNNEMTYNERLDKVFESPSFSTVFQQTVRFYLPSLAKLFRLAVTPKEVNQYFRQIAKTIIQNRKKDNLIYNDFAQFVIDFEKSHGTKLNEETVTAAHMLSFATDVYETSAITMSFLIIDMANQPAIQEKVRNEIVSLLKKYNGKLTYDALKEMTYLEKVLNESQRMHHITGIFSKICTKKIKLVGKDELSCVIKPGQKVVFSAYGLQMDPKYWQEPEKFNPERFNEENNKTRHKFTFLPFGEGPRVCVGMRMGVILIKMAVAAILKDFSVEVSPKMIFPIEKDESSFFNSPKGGFWVNIRSLNN